MIECRNEAEEATVRAIRSHVEHGFGHIEIDIHQREISVQHGIKERFKV